MRARAVVIDGYDGLEGLRVEEVAVPAPGPAEVRVAVAAAGIGPWDVFTADGAFAALLGDAEHAATFPMVLGWDLAGVVEDAGADADLAPGTRVLAMTRQPLSGVGAHAERVTLPAALCVQIPDAVSDAAAATIPCCALTAWQAVEHAGPSGEEPSLLVLGATGQLGGFVTQIAAARGFHVIASVAGDGAAEARALGAAEVVDRAGDVGVQVRELLPGGVAAAFDPVGGEATPQAIAAIRDGGTHLRAVTWAPPAEQRGITTHTLFVQDDRGALGRLAAMLAEGTISARVKEVVPIAEARRAYEAVARGQVGGKLVLDPRR